MFLDLEFPRRIALGAVSAVTWRTTVTETVAGWQQANQEWANARHEFDVSLVIRTVSDYELVRSHFHAVRGRLHAFAFRDPLDHAVTTGAGVLVQMGETTWRLAKRYGDAVQGWTRRITRPTSWQITRTRDGETSVITPTVDAAGGFVEIEDHEAGDVYAWAGEFDVPVRYGMDRLPSAAVDRQPQAGELLVSVEGITLIEERE